MRLGTGGRQQAQGRVPSGRALVPGDPEIRRTAGRPARPRPGNARLGHPADISTSPSDSARAASRARLPCATNLVLGVHEIRFDPFRPGRMRSQFSRRVTEWQPPEVEGGEGPAPPRRYERVSLRATLKLRTAHRIWPSRRRAGGSRRHLRHRGGQLRRNAPGLRPMVSATSGDGYREGRSVRCPGAGAAHRETGVTPEEFPARVVPVRAPRASTRQCSTDRVPYAADALSATVGQRPFRSAHSATSRTTVSGWSVRKKCSPGRISSRKPALV